MEGDDDDDEDDDDEDDDADDDDEDDDDDNDNNLNAEDAGLDPSPALPMVAAFHTDVSHRIDMVPLSYLSLSLSAPRLSGFFINFFILIFISIWFLYQLYHHLPLVVAFHTDVTHQISMVFFFFFSLSTSSL